MIIQVLFLQDDITQKSFSTLFFSSLLSFHLSFPLFSSFPVCMSSNLHQRIFSRNFPSFLSCPSVLLLCSFRVMSKQKCYPTNLLLNEKNSSCKVISVFLSLRLPLPVSSLSFVGLLTVPALSSSSCLSSSLRSPLPPVTHLSLIFTNQYAGQQTL